MRSDVLNENSSSYGKQYQLENVELVSAAKTLSLSDSGKTFMVESSGGAFTITLPPTTQNQPGWNAKFVVQEKTPTGDITIAAGSAIINIVNKDAGEMPLIQQQVQKFLILFLTQQLKEVMLLS